MEISFLCDRDKIRIQVPDDSIIYESSFPKPASHAGKLALDAVNHPIEGLPIKDALKRRKPGSVVIVVSDITRPIAYSQFLLEILKLIEAEGVSREDIVILIATGMHRQTTLEEKREMFGYNVANNYNIIDHRADHYEDLVEIPGKSWSGNKVRLNKVFVNAGFKLVTGLVEPHFMAGFSGGRKVICPGLVSLDTIQQFHGEEFMAHQRTCNGILEGNPCHEESLSIARLAEVDFSLNVVLNKDRRVIKAFAGDVEKAHHAACEFVRKFACSDVKLETDVVITSSGGYPLDSTFYQCVKGFVSCLPAVRQEGTIISFGGCREGIGGPEYTDTMSKYANRWRDFLEDIKKPNLFTKDQWQFQMHTRALSRVGQENLYFITDGLSADQIDKLSVHGVAVEKGGVQQAIQERVDELLRGGKRLAVFPEGPYCVPTAGQ